MTDYNTRQKKRHVMVGVFVIIAFIAFVVMVFQFGELPLVLNRPWSYGVVVDFMEAPGVQENTPVYYCGYQIGRVAGITPPFLDESVSPPVHRIRVILSLRKQKDLNIPSNVSVLLLKRGLGSSYITLQSDPVAPLVPLDPARPETVYLVDGIMLRGRTGVSSEFFPAEVQKKLESLVDSITTLTNHANDVLGDPKNKVNVSNAIANIASAAEQTSLTMKNANDILGDPQSKVNLREAIARIASAAEQAQETLSSLQKFSESGNRAIADVAEQMNDTLRELQIVLAKINEGQGTAGRLINDAGLYENLLESSQELQLALEQLKKLAAEARERGIRIKW